MRKGLQGIIIAVLLLLFSGQAVAATHIVQPGETLWIISRKYGTTVAELATLNKIANVDYIEAGQTLVVPGGEKAAQAIHTVRPGDTLYKIAMQYGTTVARIAAANNISNVDLIYAGTKLVIPGADAPVGPVSRGGRTVSAAEMDLLARLVHAEAGGEPYQGQVAVAATVLNRVDSPRYPSTITAVIYQVVDGHYQYSPVLDGRINLPATETARRAVAEALTGADPSLGATGFYNPRKTTNQWVRSQPVTVVIGNHVFFRY
ncbi:MAG TPA: LysM peptidoglycan-binding domain-containing protein [Firmicutes bacterium]|nr:LysM peptidoglycan-binding domain-containing protein [Bacillota bacterium]